MLSPDDLLRRAAREVEPGERVFLGPGLPRELEALLPDGATIEDGPADLVVIEVDAASADGRVDAPTAGRIVALVPTPAFVAEGQGSGRVSRFVTPVAVLEPAPEGLVVTEVPAGTSARDVQGHAPFPLLAAPTLAPLR